MKNYPIYAGILATLLCLCACTEQDTTALNAPADPIAQQQETADTENGQQPSFVIMDGQDPNGQDSSDGKKHERKTPDGNMPADGKPPKQKPSDNGKPGEKGDRKQKPSDSSQGSGKKKQSGKQSGKKSSASQSGESSLGGAAVILTDGDAVSGGTYTATEADQSVMEASGTVTASITGAVLNKASGNASSSDASNFRGVNAGVRVYGQANVSLNDVTVNASAKNATGVFAYENGVITMDSCTVTVTGGGAGGVQVAGGGTLYGTNLTVTSASKAAIRSDRGGGTMILDGGTYTSTGSDGCPAIYSTADITVKNADCVSTNSRAVIIEGKNTVTLENCTVSGNDQSTKEGSVRANVLLYQSASGDAAAGTSVFTMTGGSMKSSSGAMFYCTNTDSVINLESAELLLSDDGTLLTVAKGRWGREGRNGGDCTLNAKDQILAGDIAVDAVSVLTLNLTEGSSFSGKISGEGKTDVRLDASSSWTLTGDSYVTSLSGDLSSLKLNGFTLYVSGVPFAG